MLIWWQGRENDGFMGVRVKTKKRTVTGEMGIVCSANDSEIDDGVGDSRTVIDVSSTPSITWFVNACSHVVAPQQILATSVSVTVTVTFVVSPL